MDIEAKIKDICESPDKSWCKNGGLLSEELSPYLKEHPEEVETLIKAFMKYERHHKLGIPADLLCIMDESIVINYINTNPMDENYLYVAMEALRQVKPELAREKANVLMEQHFNNSAFMEIVIDTFNELRDKKVLREIQEKASGWIKEYAKDAIKEIEELEEYEKNS